MKINKKIGKLLVLVLGVTVSISSSGQENYLEGKVITLSGDTLSGFIDYGNWAYNPGVISFRSSSGVISSYGPSDIKSFIVKDEYYIGAKVNTELSSRNVDNIDYNNKLELRESSVFLQAIVVGAKSLYFLKNKNGITNYYVDEDSTFALLEYKKYLEKQNGVVVKKENKKFIGQLNLYLGDCQLGDSKLNTLKYSTKSLEKLFEYYYDCKNIEMDFQKKREKFALEYGVIAGGTMSKLEFGEAAANSLKAGFDQSYGFSGGLFLDIIIPRSLQKWSINNEIIYTSYKVNNRYDEIESVNIYTYTFTDLAYSYIKLNNMLRFKYPIGSSYLYANAGISNGYAISEVNKERVEMTRYTIERVEEGKALEQTRKYEQGILFGLGFKYKKYSVEARYERGNGMSDFSDVSSVVNRYYFLLGYKF